MSQELLQLLPIVAYVTGLITVWIKFTNRITILETKLYRMEKEMVTVELKMEDHSRTITKTMSELQTALTRLIAVVESIEKRFDKLEAKIG